MKARFSRSRVCALLVTLGAVGCLTLDVGGGRLPGPLREIMLVEDHPGITPVRFHHALHVDPVVMGRDVACADCHHPLDDDPGRVPEACTTCHIPLYLQPEVDESLPHEHARAPDL